MPSVQSSARGKRRRQGSLTPEHPSKVHCIQLGLSTPVQMYQVQAPGGLAIPTPTSRLVHPSSVGPTTSSVGRAPNLMGLPLSVLQQPIPASVLGTATHPAVLDRSLDQEHPGADQSTLDQEYPDADQEPLPVVPEQPRMDLNQYHWLFTAAKGESWSAIEVGRRQYQLATEAFWQACELDTVRMTGCVNYISNLAQYIGVCPKESRGGPNPQKAE
jgi:hypothetical protein